MGSSRRPANGGGRGLPSSPGVCISSNVCRVRSSKADSSAGSPSGFWNSSASHVMNWSEVSFRSTSNFAKPLRRDTRSFVERVPVLSGSKERKI